MLLVRGQLAPRDAWHDIQFDPFRPGGWAMQLFLNTDGADTGYWIGFDYLVRGTELMPDGALVMRAITLDPQYPGGWGPQTGSATFAPASRSFRLEIPLDGVGRDDGVTSYALEMYSTISCPECPDGYNYMVLDDYFGSTTLTPGLGREPLPPSPEGTPVALHGGMIARMPAGPVANYGGRPRPPTKSPTLGIGR
jgi:hypothetical protein